MKETMIPGYTYGSREVARSPLSLSDLELLKKTVMFGDEDVYYLRMSHDVLKPHVSELVKTWYDFIGANPQLLAAFSTPDGRPIPEYLERVRERFEQWILDTARAEYDHAWLDYQYEIGLRHYRTKKNRTDDVEAMDIVPFRYLFLLLVPVLYTMKPYLERDGRSDVDVQRMFEAWQKSVLLQLTLWSQPYLRPEDF